MRASLIQGWPEATGYITVPEAGAHVAMLKYLNQPIKLCNPNTHNKEDGTLLDKGCLLNGALRGS